MKDRLEAFHRLVQDNGDHLAGDSRTSNAKLTAETSQYFEETLRVQTAIEDLKEIVDELEKTQTKVLVSTLQNDGLDRELSDCEGQAKKACSAITQQLKDLDQCLKNSESRGQTVETRMKRDQLSALRRVFESIMSKYNTSLLNHKENCKKRIQRQLEITGNKKNDDQIEQMLHAGDLNVMMSQLVLETKDARAALREVESRHEDILRLEKSIEDLFALFNDMAAHVSLQNEMLDRIESNVERTATTIQEALPQLKKARHYKKPKLFQWFS